MKNSERLFGISDERYHALVDAVEGETVEENLDSIRKMEPGNERDLMMFYAGFVFAGSYT